MEGAATKVAGKWFVAGVLPVGSSEEGEEGRRGGGDEKMKSGGDGRREMKRVVGGEMKTEQFHGETEHLNNE